ncbi:tRNA (guanine(37)-N(1))-methyltransferase [Bifidobacterium stellenboschense]|uniref:tRNA (guanine-N(1)-)-methyltransferase n=1 Tax=Bifidobacterium stellenboschense TaxID=762211 RepID=A0A087DFG5_9BIFI|nr:tRNA (guanine(37)-N(1))-methyltransferase [Bifidobacterium stellenboschense]KFI94265.1 tRNA (guanine-N(1)-)-methyltransferase [Bifidobacterium stellenboschense]
MKIDIVSVFPEYFDVMGLSLMGKAQEKGLLTITAHNLRDWTHDVHHSVDDTPVGGGAGMVMKPAVWAECLDELLGLEPQEGTDAPHEAATETVTATHTITGKPVSDETPADTDIQTPVDTDIRRVSTCGTAGESGPKTVENAESSALEDSFTVSDETPACQSPQEHTPVLIFPNPSAPLFTQRDATELSHAEHLLFGCGRYEGYDARIPEYYRSQGIDVREYSIGDYVLNGGEVATSVMVEAITRLIPGFMGNADSIVEESYTGANALLEHRQYTKPAEWRGLKVPDVLLSGDHGKVDRYRRDEALTRTDEIRPDLIEQLDCKSLDKADRKTLMALGWEVSTPHPRKLR